VCGSGQRDCLWAVVTSDKNALYLSGRSNALSKKDIIAYSTRHSARWHEFVPFRNPAENSPQGWERHEKATCGDHPSGIERPSQLRLEYRKIDVWGDAPDPIYGMEFISKTAGRYEIGISRESRIDAQYAFYHVKVEHYSLEIFNF
jgi:hypothetical protein